MVKEMIFSTDFDSKIVSAILPQMRDIGDSINSHIQRDAPVDTGTLKEASHAVLDDNTGIIDVGVDGEVINPKTHQRVGSYARYVIEGTSEQHANQYLELSTEAALQEQRLRGKR